MSHLSSKFVEQDISTQDVQYSLCIPTFKEQDYIVETLQQLAFQTVWRNGEIIVADYDPDGSKPTEGAFRDAGLDKDSRFANVKFVYVDRRGIGYARGFAVEKSSTKPYLVSFDADCRFNRPDAIERLLAPVVGGEAIITHCPNLMDTEETLDLLNHGLYILRNQVTTLFPMAYEPGLTISRKAYDALGGWPDVPAGEGPLMSINAIYRFGSRSLRFMTEVGVLCSARRMFSKDLNYFKAFRKGGESIDVPPG